MHVFDICRVCVTCVSGSVHACVCVCDEVTVSICLCKCSGLLRGGAP